MARAPNCLPERVKRLLQVIDRGEGRVLAEMIDESSVCAAHGECELADACTRLHDAFLPLVSKH